MDRPVVHRRVLHRVLGHLNDLVKLVANLDFLSIFHLKNDISLVLIFLNKIKAIDSFDNEVSLKEIHITHGVLEQGWLDKHRHSGLLLVKLDEVIAVRGHSKLHSFSFGKSLGSTFLFTSALSHPTIVGDRS